MGLALGLDRLLQRVEVDREAVGVQHRHEPLGAVGATAAARLDRAEVREEQRWALRGRRPVGAKQSRFVEQAPPRSKDESDPMVGGRPDQAAVDALRLIGAARHRGDQQRRLERPAEHGGAKIDVGQIAARERAVAQPDAVEPGPLAVLDILRGGDAQMVRLAPRGRCSGRVHADRTEETTDRTNGIASR